MQATLKEKIKVHYNEDLAKEEIRVYKKAESQADDFLYLYNQMPGVPEITDMQEYNSFIGSPEKYMNDALYSKASEHERKNLTRDQIILHYQLPEHEAFSKRMKNYAIQTFSLVKKSIDELEIIGGKIKIKESTLKKIEDKHTSYIEKEQDQELYDHLLSIISEVEEINKKVIAIFKANDPKNSYEYNKILFRTSGLIQTNATTGDIFINLAVLHNIIKAQR